MTEAAHVTLVAGGAQGIGRAVAAEGDVGRSVARAVAVFGRLDAVVAVAGIAAFVPLSDLDPATWRRVLGRWGHATGVPSVP